MNGPVLIPLILALLMAGAIAVASGYPYLQAKLSVTASALIVLVLSLVQLARELRLKKVKRSASETEAARPDRDVSSGRYALEAAWMAGFALTIYLLGFIIAIPLYICAYMKLHGTKWPVAVITGALMAAFSYGIFVLALEIKLYPGVLFEKF